MRQAIAWRRATILSVVVTLIALAYLTNFSAADPEGVTPSYSSNTTANTTAPGNRSDPGGYIYTITVDTTQQNVRWKAYVGNVTGKFTLDDGSGNTIYDWEISTAVTGEVFATRNTTIAWSSIACANETVRESEDSDLAFTLDAADTINNTFNYTKHVSLLVAGNAISNSTCASTFTYVNNTRQTGTEASDFQELLLADNTAKMVYATILEDDASSYKDDSPINTTYDFQMLVADEELGGASTLYYFYVELG